MNNEIETGVTNISSTLDEEDNVIRLPDQNTLNTKVKKIRNPQKEISGDFI